MSDAGLYFRTYNSLLASVMGVRESLIFGQVYYWLKLYSENPEEHAGKHFVKGHWWTFNPIETKKEGCHDWAEQFPEMSPSTIKNTLTKFTKQGLLIKGNFNRMKGDQTLWYTIDFDVLYEKFPITEELFPRVKEPLDKDYQMVVGKDSPMEQTKITRPIPNSNTNNSEPKKDNSMEFFRKKNSACLTPTELSELVVTAYTEEHREDTNEAEKLVLSEIALYFGERYQTVTGRKHPCISKQAAVRAVGNLLCSEIEVKYGERICTEEWNLLDHAVDDVYGMIDKYFQTRFAEGTEYSFSHFCSNGVLVRKWLEYRRESYTYYSDSELLPY